MNEKIFNIGTDALTTIQELCTCLIENEQDDHSQYTLIKAIQRIAIQSKYMMYIEKENNEKADN